MRVFLRGTMMLLCIYAICADAQKYQDYTERLDSIVQMSVEGKRKTVFDYQMDSLYVTEKIYKKWKEFLLISFMMPKVGMWKQHGWEKTIANMKRRGNESFFMMIMII